MLRGEKVILRGITREDLPRLRKFDNDLEMELAGGGDPPRPTALERLQKMFGLEAAEPPREKIDFVIEAGGECVGHRELGITIGDRDYWGRGYGCEAVGLFLDYSLRIRNLRRVCPEVHAENERAVRAYRACGLMEEGRQREHIWLAGCYVVNVQMGVLREEWSEGRETAEGGASVAEDA
jgi:RimJ/RimL family protein N-acetyltransferase